MHEIDDIDSGETIDRIETLREAIEICRDLNEGKLDKLYAIRCTRNP